MIQERVRAGLRRAKEEGKQLGRPRIAADIEGRILAALKARKDTGDSLRKIAVRFGVDPSTVQRISRPFDGVSVAPKRPVISSPITVAIGRDFRVKTRCNESNCEH